MNKQGRILSYLTNTAAALCLFFVVFLPIIKHPDNAWIFVIAAAIFLLNNKIIQQQKYTTAFVVLSINANAVLLVFDVGYTSPINSYVFYFPLLLCNFMLTRHDQRMERILLLSFTILCLILTNFTNVTPRLAESLYEPQYTKIASVVNLSVALFCSVIILHIVNSINRDAENELLRIHRKIHEEEERWNYALSHNQEGVWDLNIISGKVYYSPQWKKMLGFEEHEISDDGRDWLNLLHPEDAASAQQAVSLHLEGKTDVYEHVHRMRCKDGSYKWIYARGKVCEQDANGKAARFIGTHTDITAQKLAQSALIQSQQLLNSINQNIDVAICRISKSTGKLLYVNRSYVNLFGYSGTEAALKHEPAVIYENPGDLLRIFELLDQQDSFSNMEIRYRRKNGSTFWGLLSGIRITGENGEQSYDCAMRDITYLKEVESELIQAKELAEKASAAKSQFLSTMSHEIRTPMNAVIGISNLLMEDNPKPDQMENLSVLKFSAENLLILINNILDFSKIEAGKIELEEVPVNLDQLLSSIVNAHLIEARQKDIELYLRMDTGNVFLTDPMRLSQILNNLLSNAIKFTEKGEVSMSVEVLDESDESALLRFTVQDSGIGIAQDKIPLIFESFSQENREISRRFGGTGLGLAITRLLLDLMHSRINVESVQGKGSAFSFNLRLPKSVDSQSEPSGMRTGYDLQGMRILLVEDNQMNIMLVNKFLKRWNVNVDIVLNGNDAINRVRSNQYDLVLMDLHMPEIDGYQATRSIRRFNTGIPIYALTADAFADTRTRALSCGMNDFISKPFNPEELYNKIARLRFNPVNS